MHNNRLPAADNITWVPAITSQWRHNEGGGISTHQPHDCLLNRLFRRRSKKHRSSASLAFVWGIQRWPVNSPQKGPVTRKNVSIWWRHHDHRRWYATLEDKWKHYPFILEIINLEWLIYAQTLVTTLFDRLYHVNQMGRFGIRYVIP